MYGFDGTEMDWSNACPVNKARRKKKENEVPYIHYHHPIYLPKKERYYSATPLGSLHPPSVPTEPGASLSPDSDSSSSCLQGVLRPSSTSRALTEPEPVSLLDGEACSMVLWLPLSLERMREGR